MNVYRPEQFKSIDEYTLAHHGWSAWELMERAAIEVVAELNADFPVPLNTLIWVGPGNNGGDGLAVARLLHQLRWPVRVVQVGEAHPSEAYTKNRDALPKDLFIPFESLAEAALNPVELMIDALFGVGLNRAVEGDFAQAVQAMNRFDGLVYSLDVPSGLGYGSQLEGVVSASKTLTFQFPKSTFFEPGIMDAIGQLSVLNIGLDDGAVDASDSAAQYITRDEARGWMPLRNLSSHKGSCGTTGVIAGSTSMLGAGSFVCRAAHRAGSGRVQWVLPSHLHAAAVQLSPESTFTEDWIGGASSLVIGPGWGVEPEQARVLKRVLQESAVPLVLDADALTILGENPTWLSFLPSETVLTPHLNEFHRLVQRETRPEERLQVLKDSAVRWQCVIVLKGPHTAIATPSGQLFFNETGNPALAAAGTGDVLAGLIGGYLAQGMPLVHAVLYAVNMHGWAADQWIQYYSPLTFGPEALITTLQNI